MGWPKEIANNKIKVPLWMEKGQKTNLNKAQEQGSWCHHHPRLYLL
jgi:hypothetical protein